jgi:hypothetical protein
MNRLIFLISAILVFFLVSVGYSSFMTYYSNKMAKETHDELDYKDQEHLLLRQVLDELIAANDLKYKDYTLKVVPISSEEQISFAQVNLGRQVSFSSEFLYLMKTKQGLAFVMAHEMAHSELKHLTDIFALVYGGKQLGSDKKNSFHDKRYSKSKEFVADAKAVDYLLNTYKDIDIEDVLEMFLVIEVVEEHMFKSGVSEEEYKKELEKDGSHPDHDSRRKAIKSQIEAFRSSS